MAVFEKHSFIRGHHINHRIWTPELGECLVYEREPTNVNDRYAVAVVKDDVAVSHLPRAQSKIHSLFLLRNGTIDCIITGSKRYSAEYK